MGSRATPLGLSGLRAAVLYVELHDPRRGYSTLLKYAVPYVTDGNMTLEYVRIKYVRTYSNLVGVRGCRVLDPTSSILTDFRIFSYAEYPGTPKKSSTLSP